MTSCGRDHAQNKSLSYGEDQVSIFYSHGACITVMGFITVFLAPKKLEWGWFRVWDIINEPNPPGFTPMMIRKKYIPMTEEQIHGIIDGR